MNAQSDDRVRDECPSWASLARFVAEGGPWPVEHLRRCARCMDRRRFLESLSADGFGDERVLPAGPGCPDVIDVIAIVEGSVSQKQRLSIVDHISGCEGCGSLFQQLAALSETGELDWEIRDGPAAPNDDMLPKQHASFLGRYSSARYVAAVVVLTMALAAVLFVPFPVIETGESGRWRGPAATLEATLDWPEVEAFPTVRADSFAGADSYRVRVWDARGEQLLERHRTAAEALSVAIELPNTPPGDVLFWQVDVLVMGEVISSSGPRQLIWNSR